MHESLLRPVGRIVPAQLSRIRSRRLAINTVQFVLHDTSNSHHNTMRLTRSTHLNESHKNRSEKTLCLCHFTSANTPKITARSSFRGFSTGSIYKLLATACGGKCLPFPT